MAKPMMFICIALLIGGVISASTGRAASGPACGRAGDTCHVSDDCCPNLWCHTYAGHCVTKEGKKFGYANAKPSLEDHEKRWKID